MALSVSERNRRWRTKFPEKHAACYEDWRIENKERRNAYARKWHAEKRAKDPINYAKNVRKNVLKRKYGIAPSDYEALLALQGGCCALCDRTPIQERDGVLRIDHCHDTGRVRGLLCDKHNLALGRMGDNEASLQRALDYIKGGI